MPVKVQTFDFVSKFGEGIAQSVNRFPKFIYAGQSATVLEIAMYRKLRGFSVEIIGKAE